MGVGHKVRTSCWHQQKPGAESHQEEKLQNKVDQQSPSGRVHQPRNRVGHRKQSQLVVCSATFGRKLELPLPPLDFQPVYIYGRWASSQNQLFASTRTWCWSTSRRKIPKQTWSAELSPYGWGHQPRIGVGHPSQNQLLVCSTTTIARKLELWIFNPCASMGVGHQVRTSCLHTLLLPLPERHTNVQRPQRQLSHFQDLTGLVFWQPRDPLIFASLNKQFLQ